MDSRPGLFHESTVSVAVALDPNLAVMIAFVELVTLLVVNLNLAEVDPAGMTTDAGTTTLELSLERVNMFPRWGIFPIASYCVITF